MNKQDNVLAIKIFNHFFKKAKITKIRIYSRETEKAIAWYGNLPKGTFGLDIYDTNKCWHSLVDDNLDLSNFKSLARCAVLVNDLHKRTISLDKMPDSLKIAVINSCIASNASVFSYGGSKTSSSCLIPAAKSLEELAIKMELES